MEACRGVTEDVTGEGRLLRRPHSCAGATPEFATALSGLRNSMWTDAGPRLARAHMRVQCACLSLQGLQPCSSCPDCAACAVPALAGSSLASASGRCRADGAAARARQCLGRALAVVMHDVAVATLLAQFSFRLSEQVRREDEPFRCRAAAPLLRACMLRGCLFIEAEMLPRLHRQSSIAFQQVSV